MYEFAADPKSKDIGVSLSGSGYLFPVHVGALAALEDLGYNIVEISGTSGGGLVSSLYATGMSIPDMKQIVLDSDFSAMMKLRWWGWWDGFCSPTQLYKWIDQHTNELSFKDTKIPLTLMSTDILTEQPFEFSTNATPDTLIAIGARATSSIPFIYPAVKYDNKVLMDGGVVNYIPVNKLTTPNKVGIYLSSGNNLGSNSNWISTAMAIINTMLSANEGILVNAAASGGATMCKINVPDGNALKRSYTTEQKLGLYNTGYTTVQNQFK
jgi:NTE family protein